MPTNDDVYSQPIHYLVDGKPFCNSSGQATPLDTNGVPDTLETWEASRRAHYPTEYHRCRACLAKAKLVLEKRDGALLL